MNSIGLQQWNYFVLNLNITKPAPAPNPEEASKKLKGSLSPSFIKDQFPQEYKEVKQGPSLEKQIQVLLEPNVFSPELNDNFWFAFGEFKN